MLKIDKQHSKEIHDKTLELISLLQMVPTDRQLGSGCNRSISVLLREIRKFNEVGEKGEKS